MPKKLFFLGWPLPKSDNKNRMIKVNINVIELNQAEYDKKYAANSIVHYIIKHYKNLMSFHASNIKYIFSLDESEYV